MPFVVVARILSFDVDFECQARLKARLTVVVKHICISPAITETVTETVPHPPEIILNHGSTFCTSKGALLSIFSSNLPASPAQHLNFINFVQIVTLLLVKNHSCYCNKNA